MLISLFTFSLSKPLLFLFISLNFCRHCKRFPLFCSVTLFAPHWSKKKKRFAPHFNFIEWTPMKCFCLWTSLTRWFYISDTQDLRGKLWIKLQIIRWIVHIIWNDILLYFMIIFNICVMTRERHVFWTLVSSKFYMSLSVDWDLTKKWSCYQDCCYWFCCTLKLSMNSSYHLKFNIFVM